MSVVLARLAACFLLVALTFSLAAVDVGAVSTKSVDTTSPIPDQEITYTIAIDEASDQHNGRPIYSVTITDEIVAPYAFVSASCSLSCTLATPPPGASGTVTITGFGEVEGPHDPTLTGTVTIVVAAPGSVGEAFTNQACLDVFVTTTLADPQYCVSAAEVITVAAPTATPTETVTAQPTSTATATATDTPTATATSTVAPSVTSTAELTSTPSPTSEPTSTSTATMVVPTSTADADLADAATTGDVTSLPSTGVPAGSEGTSRSLLATAFVLAALTLGAVSRRLIRG